MLIVQDRRQESFDFSNMEQKLDALDRISELAMENHVKELCVHKNARNMNGTMCLKRSLPPKSITTLELVH